MKAKVYFTRELTPEALLRLYDALDVQLPGTRTSFAPTS